MSTDEPLKELLAIRDIVVGRDIKKIDQKFKSLKKHIDFEFQNYKTLLKNTTEELSEKLEKIENKLREFEKTSNTNMEGIARQTENQFVEVQNMHLADMTRVEAQQKELYNKCKNNFSTQISDIYEHFLLEIETLKTEKLAKDKFLKIFQDFSKEIDQSVREDQRFTGKKTA